MAIEKSQMRKFCQKLPNDLNETIHKKVVTMLAMQKHVNVADTKVYDTNVINSSVIGRKVDVKDVHSHELPPVPTSLFEATGELRATTSKLSLKRQLRAKLSFRKSPETAISIIDLYFG